jgi:hypothetical protein
VTQTTQWVVFEKKKLFRFSDIFFVCLSIEGATRRNRFFVFVSLVFPTVIFSLLDDPIRQL